MSWLDPPTQVCTPWDLDLSCCDAVSKFKDEQVTESILWSSNELWWATGQRIGLCEATVHVCPRRCFDARWWDWCGSDDCPPYDVIDLGPQIVTEVASVAVNGDPLALNTDYVVLDWRYLAKLSGNWPDSGTVIQYTYGEPPNISALRAGEVLACEDLRRKGGDKSCRLARDRSARRDGRFEIPAVDAWISLQNREDDCGIMDPSRVQGFWRVTSGS